MTRLLQEAIDQAMKLSPADQDSLAAWMLEALAKERRWDDLFAQSPELLEKLAAEAIAEDDAGLTEPLDPDSL